MWNIAGWIVFIIAAAVATRIVTAGGPHGESRY